MIPANLALRPRAVAALRMARQEIGAVAAVAVAAAAGLAFIELSDDMTEADGRAFDEGVLSTLRPDAAAPAGPLGPWWLAYVAEDLTSLGSTAVLGTMALIAVGLLLFQNRRGSAVRLAATLLGAVVISEAVKSVFDRARPPDIYRTFETLNSSFPSGHALLATTFYLTLGVVLARTQRLRRLKAYIIGVAVTLALVVGVTRVYLAAHWASDVMAGWCLGAAWAMGCWLLAYALERSGWLARRNAAAVAPVPEGGGP